MKVLKLLALALMASCSSKVVTEYQDVEALRASLIYRQDSVLAYIKKYAGKNKSIADSYFDKAKNEEAQNPEKAVYLYKRAITLNPTKDAYLKLADILWKLKRYEELHNLYYCLNNATHSPAKEDEYLFGLPDEDLYYESLASGYMAWHYVPVEDFFGREQWDQGEVDRLKQRFKNDARLNHDTTSAQFKKALLQFMGDIEREKIAKQPGMFNSFIASIKDTSNSFEIDERNIGQFSYENFNGIADGDDWMSITFESVYSYFLKETQDNKNSWIRFNLNHAPRLNSAFHTVVYAVDTSETACPRDMRHVYHRLATYDQAGNITDSRIIASQAGEELVTCRMNGSKAYCTRYKRLWKKPYDRKDFDNDLTGISKLGEAAYEIGSDGKIKDLTTESPGL